jgi:hypothetical protein
LFIGQFVMGYSDNQNFGIFKRGYIATTSVLTGVFLAWLMGSWWLLVPHVLVSGGTVIFGRKNPVKAPAEEMLVALMNNLVTVFYVFI